MTRRLLTSLILAAALAAPAPAGAAPPPRQPAPPTLTLDIVDVPLPQALSTLARAAGVDLVIEGQLAGTVTVHLSHQTFAQALALLAQAYRLDVRAVGGGYLVRQLEAGQMVITAPQAQSQEPVVRAYHLRYAPASEVADELKAVLGIAQPQKGQSLVVGQPPQVSSPAGTTIPSLPGAPQPTAAPAPPPGGTGYGSAPTPAPIPSPAPAPAPAPVTPPSPSPSGPGAGRPQGASQQQAVAVASDDRTNTVVVTAPFALQVQVQEAIERLDRPEPGPAVVGPQGDVARDGQAGEQVLPQTYRYAVRYADPQAMAQVLQAEVPGVSVVTDLRTNTLLVTGDAGAQRRVASVLRALDTPAVQIVIQTEILDLNRTAASQLGIQWTWQPYTINQVSVGGTPILQQAQPLAQAVGIVPIVATLNALVSNGEGRVLANPQVATQDGVQASINVGQTLYVPITNVTNGVATTTLQTINAGILLQVTPRLNRDGVVTNTIDVQSNSISGFTPQGYPEITTRAVQSIMTVRDGEPILIGGLISQTTTEAIQKIPLLGDIPIIGNLFRYTNKTDQYDNIVIVLTPRVLAPGAAAPAGASGT
jgi:type II secretory pathway component GspD/PulD (secretin)